MIQQVRSNRPYRSAGQLNGNGLSAIFMNRVVSLNGHGGDAIRYHYAAQAAGKRLLILMGMVKNTRCQDSAVGRHHIPFIFPTQRLRLTA